jgi:hypothetical protein
MNGAISYLLVDGLLIVGLLFAACLIWDRVRLSSWKSRFDSRFPPLSTEEFLQRCGPGVNPATALRVRQIVAGQLGLPESQIYPEQEFHRDLDL